MLDGLRHVVDFFGDPDPGRIIERPLFPVSEINDKITLLVGYDGHRRRSYTNVNGVSVVDLLAFLRIVVLSLLFYLLYLCLKPFKPLAKGFPFSQRREPLSSFLCVLSRLRSVAHILSDLLGFLALLREAFFL